MCSFIFIFSNGAIYSISDLCERVRDHIKQCSVVRQGFHHSLKFCTVNEEGFWTQFRAESLEASTPTSKSRGWQQGVLHQLSSWQLPYLEIRFNQVKGSFPQACPLLQGQEQIQVVTCASNRSGHTSEFPATPPWGSINLPEWFTKLRETFHLQVPVYYKRILKGMNQQPDKKIRKE